MSRKNYNRVAELGLFPVFLYLEAAATFPRLGWPVFDHGEGSRNFVLHLRAPVGSRSRVVLRNLWGVQPQTNRSWDL